MAECQSNELIDKTKLSTLQFILHKQFIFIFKLWEKYMQKTAQISELKWVCIINDNYLTETQDKKMTIKQSYYMLFNP